MVETIKDDVVGAIALARSTLGAAIGGFGGKPSDRTRLAIDPAAKIAVARLEGKRAALEPRFARVREKREES